MISLPSIIAAVDNSMDISFFYGSTEEEKGNETFKDFEIIFSNPNKAKDSFSDLKNENILGYYFKKYSKPHLNLISPPPDYI